MNAGEQALYERFMAAQAGSGLSAEAVSALCGGNPSGPSIRRFEREGPPGRFDAKTLRGMELFLASHETAATSGYNEAREESELARVGALGDALLRALERESIAAVIRAQGMRDACRAARIEAEKAPTRALQLAVPFSEDDVSRIVRRTLAEIPLPDRTRNRGAGKSRRRVGGAG
jgi:hypothetical protein